MNGLGNVEIMEGTISSVEGIFDMIAANLMSEVLIEIAPEIASRLETGGTALLSGMLVGQEGGVIAAMEDAGLTVREQSVDDRCVSLVLTR